MSGKYCFKCGKEVVKCKCDDINYIFKETDRAEEIEKEGLWQLGIPGLNKDEFADIEKRLELKAKTLTSRQGEEI